MDPQPSTPVPEQPAPAPDVQPAVAPAPAPVEQSMQAQPAMSATPAPQPAAPMPQPAPVAHHAGEDPGKTLGIVGLILAFIAPLFGIILSIMGMKKSKKAGHTNALAIVGLVLSIINFILGTIFLAGVIFGFIATVQQCADLGPGVHYVDGATITCN